MILRIFSECWERRDGVASLSLQPRNDLLDFGAHFGSLGCLGGRRWWDEVGICRVAILAGLEAGSSQNKNMVQVIF